MQPVDPYCQSLSLQTSTGPQGALTLSLTGRLVLENWNSCQRQILRQLDIHTFPALTLNLAGLDFLDSAGALLLVTLAEKVKARGGAITFTGASPDAQRLLGLIDPQAITAPPLKIETQVPFLAKVGAATRAVASDFHAIHAFVGGLLRALLQACRHPRQVRWLEVLFYMKRAGADALPILGLMSLLMGMVIAFMSALQLEQLGATIYVAGLVGVAMVKELGPLLTAILIAGRSGSAFAAEIGTMMVNEEVDALVVMGFEPISFLAVPKVLAAVLVVPLLTVYSMLIGILGGLLIGTLLLDISIYTYITETQKALSLFDLLTSLGKAGMFAVIVAGIGCQRGFQVHGGAEAVGNQTTSAVVAGLFLIIVLDAMFAIATHYLR